MQPSNDGPRERPAGTGGSLAVINGLRGWAIAGVVWHHSGQPLFTPTGFAARRFGPYLFAPQALVSHGAFGVNLFFILSGLVLALPYARGERRMASMADARAYYARRARRLLPLYYLVLAVSFYMRPLAKLSSETYFRDVLSLATFTFSFNELRFFSWYDPVLWSLSVEVWFSVAFPVVVLAWQRLGMRRVLFVALAMSLAVRLYATLRHPGVVAALDFIKDSLAGRLDDFVVGMALAVWFARSPAWSRGAIVTALLGGLCLLDLCANGWDNVFAHRLPYVLAAAINDVQAAGFALITASLLAFPPRLVALPFVAPPIQLLGMMSYSVYLWHTIGGHGPNAGIEDMIPYLSMCFSLSAITYRFVEFPTRTFRALFLAYPRLPARSAADSRRRSSRPAPTSSP